MAHPNPSTNAHQKQNPSLYDYSSSSPSYPLPRQPSDSAYQQSSPMSASPYFPQSPTYPPSSNPSLNHPIHPQHPQHLQHPHPHPSSPYDPQLQQQQQLHQHFQQQLHLHPSHHLPQHPQRPHPSTSPTLPYLPNSSPPGSTPHDPTSASIPQPPQISPITTNPLAHPGSQSAPLPHNAMYPPYLPQPTLTQPPLINHPSIIPSVPPPMANLYPAPIGATPQRDLQTAVVKLEISAKGLRDRDITSKSDPTCVVFMEEKNSNPYVHLTPNSDSDNVFNQQSSGIRWREIGRTECIKNNLNPHFKVQVSVPYHFEEIQNIRLGLWDIDSRKQELGHHDFLGDIRTTIGELVKAGLWTSKLSSPNVRDTKTIIGRIRDLGTITVIVHENRDGGQLLIKGAITGHKLDKKDIFTSDPYFILTQVGASSAQSRTPIYQSEVIPKNVNPIWRPFQAKAAVPKGGGKQQITLEFLVYDRDRRKTDDEIGKAECSLADLDAGFTLPVINPKKQRRRAYKNKYKNSGTLKFTKFAALPMPSLVDYLQGGLKLHFSVAVDCTKSNGDPSEPLSLHYRQDVYGNHYIRALCAIANVLRVYTPSDNLFAAFGFGAELPGRPGFTSSCFPLGLGADPHYYGIEGILHAYNTALTHVKLSGPTNFAPIIEIVSRTARQRPNTQADQNYDVLLILTDGVVSDFDLTVDRIITASKTVPLSIIIVGIGNRDFRKMRALDSDDALLKSSDGSRTADRDICQFVAFRDFEHAPPERLGAAVLAELPGNIVEYFIGACEPPITPGQRPVMPPMQ